MVSKEQKKLNRVINFLKKGLASLADDLEDTVKGINDFVKSLAKAQKDLKGVTSEEVKTVSSSSKKIAQPQGGTAAKTVAASTLFSLLKGSGPSAASAAPAAADTATAAPATASAGPPSAGGPPKAPSGGGPPSRGNLPPAPKLPPVPGSGPPSAPDGIVKTPSFAKRAAPPGGSAPPTPPGGAPVAPATAAKAGGGLSSLRDEMLEELTRLKKIMRGE